MVGVVERQLAPERIGVEDLFRAHASFVAAFLGRLGTPAAEIDDLVQEVFLVVHRKGGYEMGPAQPRSWLGAIAIRVASSRRRNAGRRTNGSRHDGSRCSPSQRRRFSNFQGKGESPGESVSCPSNCLLYTSPSPRD